MSSTSPEQIDTRAKLDLHQGELPKLSAAARATLVNRTHRVIRERALSLNVRRNRMRSLWIPMLVCAAFIVLIATAVWNLLDQYEITPTGIPDASSQMLVFMVLFFPVSAALLAMIWYRRTRLVSGSDQAR